MVTSRLFALCHPDSSVGKKLIAALLLLAIPAWAEIMLAPFLTMHAGYAHPAHAVHPAAHDHAMPMAHACCPGLKTSGEALPTIEFRAASLPCEDQDRCCFRQGPQGAPAPASARMRFSPEVALLQTADLQPELRSSSPVAIPAERGLPPPARFGTVLRI
ncbi:MAG: hypothetical protein ACHP79_02280 [Terriglobales bacterium]